MNDKIYVWDPFIRIFHWSLVLAFIVSYVSGEEESLVHVYSGYAVLGLVAARIIWGFVGPEHARFNNFITAPGNAIAYLKGLFSGDATQYTGHNPAGGWMVIALFMCLVLTGLSGLKVYGIEGYGPLAGDPVQTAALEPAGNTETGRTGEYYERDDHYESLETERHDYEDHDDDSYDSDEHEGEEHGDDSYDSDEHEGAEEFWEEIHELLANLTVLLIVVHIAGVILSSLRHQQNLVKAMFTGYKQL